MFFLLHGCNNTPTPNRKDWQSHLSQKKRQSVQTASFYIRMKRNLRLILIWDLFHTYEEKQQSRYQEDSKNC